MPEFELADSLENGGEKVKKLFKNKKFLVAAGVVGAGALILSMRDGSGDETASGELVSPTGYTGYPAVSGSSDTTESDQVYNALDVLDSQYTGQIDLLTENITALSDKLATTDELTQETQRQLTISKAISQMQANSNLYNTVDDDSLRDTLHSQNLEIASGLGLNYDPGTGNYFTADGGVAYTTAYQDAIAKGSTPVQSGKNASTPTIDFKANVDYQAEINKAILSGASSDTVNNLNNQRSAKISSTGSTVEAANKSFDESVDYSAAISKAKASGVSQAVISNLEQQRQAKINAVYGGVDPGKAAK